MLSHHDAAKLTSSKHTGNNCNSLLVRQSAPANSAKLQSEKHRGSAHFYAVVMGGFWRAGWRIRHLSALQCGTHSAAA